MSSGHQSADDDGAGERSLVLAVRRAVEDDDGAWSTERLSAVAERAAGRAARRRRRRLVVAPVAALAAAAAVAAGIVVVPELVAAERAAPSVASRPPAPTPPTEVQQDVDPVLTAAVEATGHLSSAEVRWVLPGAQPQFQPKSGRSGLGERDACGTAELDVPPPVADGRGTWSFAMTGYALDESSPDRVPPWLTSRVATYANAVQARAYVDALEASTRTCVPAEGESRPTNPQTFDIWYADAVFGSTLESLPGQYRVTAAVATGAHVATVSALVDLGEGSEEVPAKQLVAADLVHLATAAAARADGRAGADAPVDLARTPVTTGDVEAVVPGAQPLAPYTAKLSLDQQPRDACGTDPLADVATPGRVQRGAWLDPTPGLVDLGVGGMPPTAMGQAAVVITTSDFASATEARGYATAYQRSARTCTPSEHPLPPAPVDLLPAGSADALLTTAYDEAAQRYWYAAVVVRGSSATTVLARVPGDLSRATATQAAQRVVDLATSAATRAADQTASGS